MRNTFEDVEDASFDDFEEFGRTKQQRQARRT